MDEFRNAYFDVQTRGLDWWKPVWSEKEENREEWFVENSPGVRGCVALTPLQVMISFIFRLLFFRYFERNLSNHNYCKILVCFMGVVPVDQARRGA